MHGSDWFEDPIVSLVMIGAAIVFLALTIWRRRVGTGDPYNIQPKVSGHKIFDTGDRWIFFTLFIGLSAIAAHVLAEYTFHIYDVTPVDKFTHGLSGMAITAFILNLNLTRGRKVYYPVSIGVSWLAFVAWEIYEWITVMTVPNSGIEISLWDTAIDLWVDTLGALTICFFYDELMSKEHQLQKA
jgi:hypothetical protein